jgi:NAD(P)-dependent dehydrogenase (short-subunit alcohol dehydrogenase family)
MSELTGLTAVITGAGSGIGLATAQNFCAAGARCSVWTSPRGR